MHKPAIALPVKAFVEADWLFANAAWFSSHRASVLAIDMFAVFV
jgi:hypothetical protein